jgi:hypothetical protein
MNFNTMENIRYERQPIFEYVNTNPILNPNSNSNQNTILIEKHYIPYNLYCEMFNSSNSANSNRYNLFSSSLNSNQYYNNLNIPASSNFREEEQLPTGTTNNTERINIRRNITPNLRYINSTPYLRPSLYSYPPYPQYPPYTSYPFYPLYSSYNNSYTSQTSNVAPNTNTVPILHTSNTSSNNNINRIFNDFINNNLPYNFEINSNLGPIGTGFISTFMRTNINNNTETPIGIPLSNINIITSVSRFCDIINNNNTNFDTCSICYVPFNNTDICRVINNCSHIFHINCIDTWLHDHITCPFCRYNLLTINVPIDDGNVTTTNTTTTTTTNTNNEDDEDDDEEYEDEDDEEHFEDYIEFHSEENFENEIIDNINIERPIVNANIPLPTPNNNINNINNIDEEIFSNLINTEPILNDINNFVNITTPFINNFISSSTSNSSVRFNSNQINSQINRQINNFVNNLNPLLQSFSNFGANRN